MVNAIFRLSSGKPENVSTVFLMSFDVVCFFFRTGLKQVVYTELLLSIRIWSRLAGEGHSL